MTTTKATELRSFPPIEDGIDFIKQVDWEEFGTRFKGGIRNLLLSRLSSQKLVMTCRATS